MDATVVLANGDQPTEGDDVIVGTSGRDIINAGGGNDIVCGLGDDDSIFGGAGNDLLVGGPGRDIIAGSLGDDTLHGGRGRDLLIGGPGLDIIKAGRGGDWCTDEGDLAGCEDIVPGAVDEGLPPHIGAPVEVVSVGSLYGMRQHPILGTNRMHNGVDLRGETADKVLAAQGGTVVAAGRSGGYGKRLVIDHGNGYSTLYAHLRRIRVAEGDTVSAGDLVGRVGTTGLSTGPHLHFEVMVGAIRLDPLLFLDI